MVRGSCIKTTDFTTDRIDDPTFTTNTQRNLNQDHMSRESMSTEWTDEKHSLYLKSMEASFVKDLYKSYNLPGYQIEKPLDHKFSRRKHMDTCTSSRQFKVLQCGCWENTNFERKRSHSLKAGDPSVLLSNPWIQHFRSPHGHQIVASSTLHEKVELAADHLNYDSAEVTDQNFIDDEDMEEKESHTSNPKRIKIENSTAPTPMNDQVVPWAKLSGSLMLPTNSGP